MRRRALMGVLVAVIFGAFGGCSSDGAETSGEATVAPSSTAPPGSESHFVIRSFGSRWHADLEEPVDADAGTIPRQAGDGEWDLEGALTGTATVVTGVLADPRDRAGKVAKPEGFGLAGQVSFSLAMLQGSAEGCGSGTAVLWMYGDPAASSRWGIVPGFGTGRLRDLAVDDAAVDLDSTGGTLHGTLDCRGAGTYLRIDHHPLFGATSGPVAERVQQQYCYLSGCDAGMEGGTGIFIVPWNEGYFDEASGSPVRQDHPHGVVGRAVGYWIGEQTVGVYVSMSSPGSIIDDGLIGATLAWSTATMPGCGGGSHVVLQRTRFNRLGDILDSVDEIIPGLGTGGHAGMTGDGVENGTQHAPPEGGHWWSDLVVRCGP